MSAAPAMETCAKCGQPMVCGHKLVLDDCRASWRTCCLCTAELIQQLSTKPAATGSRP